MRDGRFEGFCYITATVDGYLFPSPSLPLSLSTGRAMGPLVRAVPGSGTGVSASGTGISASGRTGM